MLTVVTAAVTCCVMERLYIKPVVSSLGKGVAAAGCGALLQSRGYSVHARKFDPYLNIDPGTMSPIQHGEVYVTNDGHETDLDLGYYERFLGARLTRNDSVSRNEAEVIVDPSKLKDIKLLLDLSEENRSMAS